MCTHKHNRQRGGRGCSDSYTLAYVASICTVLRKMEYAQVRSLCPYVCVITHASVGVGVRVHTCVHACDNVFVCVCVCVCACVRAPVHVCVCCYACTVCCTFERNNLRSTSKAISAATHVIVHHKIPCAWRIADRHVTMAITHTSSTYTSMPPVTSPKTQPKTVWILSREYLSWLPNVLSADAWSVRLLFS